MELKGESTERSTRCWGCYDRTERWSRDRSDWLEGSISSEQDIVALDST